jgi:hypothetical protein
MVSLRHWSFLLGFTGACGGTQQADTLCARGDQDHGALSDENGAFQTIKPTRDMGIMGIIICIFVE